MDIKFKNSISGFQKVEKYIDGLLSDEAHEEPCDEGKVEDLEMKLPEWFDEKKFNQARRFYWDFCFMFTASMVTGLVGVFAIPSILNILVGTRRSNSEYTAYKRYYSTYLHVTSWFEHELKPGSVSWKSLYTVRSRHLQASRAAKLKGAGPVSQRDVAITLFGFIAFSMLKPEKFSITQLQGDDWEAYNHFWRVIVHMIGLKDRYNFCRSSFEETRQVCQILLNRVYTPCLENVPEYFDHAAHVTIKGLSNILTFIEPHSMIFSVKYLAGVPGYVYTENERYEFQKKLRDTLKGLSEDRGVYATELMEKCPINVTRTEESNIFYLCDFDSVDTSPAYKNLSLVAKYKLAFSTFITCVYLTYFGRTFLNLYFKYLNIMGSYFPYIAMWKYGIKNAFVNLFKEDPVDNTNLIPNSEYRKPQPEPWYKVLYGIFW